ncbi:SDR family oxidoreductase, partial [Rhodococcus globerulus]|uniref:SDR family NAD(P)-dependent oxidoreductase n=1 Tax=Rhodococcus globerulus TaxID=33008 RepID=UPI003015A876
HGVVRAFAAEGARIVVADVKSVEGEQLVAQVRSEFGVEAIFVKTDVTQKADVEGMVGAAVETWGSIDILVNNAWGGGRFARVEENTDEDLDHAFAMAPYASLWAMQAAFPTMRANRWGRVINMCSLNGVNAHMGTLDYNMAKEAQR